MSNGFMPYLLKQSTEVFKTAAPVRKITPPGWLKSMLIQPKAAVSSFIDDGSGYIRDVKIKYRTRVPEGSTSDSDDCAVDAKPVYLEATVDISLFRKYSIFLNDDDIAKYEADALATIMQGKPSSGFMKEMWDAIIEAANGLFADVNGDLISKQATSFGKNQTTGLTTAKSINFPLDMTTNPLDQGMTLLMDDIMNNEFNYNNAYIVGSGFINQAMLQVANRAASSNLANYPNMPKFFFDPAASSGWGTNEFAVVDPGAVQLINVCRFRGSKGGDKLTTILGTITLPVVDALGDSLGSYEFDYQLKYNDCPGTVSIGGTPTSVGRGWILTLMTTFDQFNVPNNAYDASDRLTGNNGTLRYVATNA